MSIIYDSRSIIDNSRIIIDDIYGHLFFHYKHRLNTIRFYLFVNKESKIVGYFFTFETHILDFNSSCTKIQTLSILNN